MQNLTSYDKLVEKWAPVLDEESAGKITDSHKKAVTAAILENQEIALREEGNLQELIECFDWASQSEDVDYIGVSILAVPLAYGVERDNKLQRFLSRWKFMFELEKAGILDRIFHNKKKIHFLGMVDGPNEIELVQEWLPHITSWDSSAAVWAGMCHIPFDQSPTGLIDGKNEIEVDFSHKGADNTQIRMAMENCRYIDKMLEELYWPK